MVSYFKIDYTLKNSKGETADFCKFPTSACIVAPDASSAVEDLKDTWRSWDVDVHNVSGKLEMTDEEYENG